MIALDDYNSRADFGAFLDIADIVKIDFATATVAERAQYATDLRARGLTLLAEKVERQEDVEQAVKLGILILPGVLLRATRDPSRTTGTCDQDESS